MPFHSLPTLNMNLTAGNSESDNPLPKTAWFAVKRALHRAPGSLGSSITKYYTLVLYKIRLDLYKTNSVLYYRSPPSRPPRSAVTERCAAGGTPLRRRLVVGARGREQRGGGHSPSDKSVSYFKGGGVPGAKKTTFPSSPVREIGCLATLAPRVASRASAVANWRALGYRGRKVSMPHWQPRI